jgi:hypothetical protein
MAKIVSGWSTNNIPGWAAQQELIADEDGNWLVVLTQTFRVPDRGQGEIMAAVMRLEGAGKEGAEWETWDPTKLRFMNNARAGL